MKPAGRTGAPVFAATTGALECKALEIIERYDTALVIAEILWAHKNEDARPMLHFQGKVME